MFFTVDPERTNPGQTIPNLVHRSILHHPWLTHHSTRATMSRATVRSKQNDGDERNYWIGSMAYHNVSAYDGILCYTGYPLIKK